MIRLQLVCGLVSRCDTFTVSLWTCLGGPGSGRGTQAKRILERYKEVVHLSMGDILRSQIADKGTADDKWNMIGSLVSKGEMAPQVTNPRRIVLRSI